MNQQEYKQLTTETIERRVLGLADLVNRTPRTLIFGYTCDRNTFHVYIGADNLIHVLLYSERFCSEEEGGPKFYELGHTFGECGGLQENSGYVPDKRVYPESCDYEFCKVLKSYGVNIPFTTFDEGADEHRKEARKGYAGLTHEDGGIGVVYLHPQLAEDPAFPSSEVTPGHSYALTSRLVSQAARDLRAAEVSSMDGGYVRVAEPDAERVLAKAREFLHQLPETTVLESHLDDTLFYEAFDSSFSPVLFDESYNAGEFSVRVGAKHLELASGPNLKQYVGKPEGFYEKAVLGTYKGRPFIACKNKFGEAEIRFSQFGDTERFLEIYLRIYGLTPAQPDKVPAPVTAEVTPKPVKIEGKRRKTAKA